MRLLGPRLVLASCIVLKGHALQLSLKSYVYTRTPGLLSALVGELSLFSGQQWREVGAEPCDTRC